MIIDCHTHLNRYADDEPEDLHRRYLRMKGDMAAHGIDFAIVIDSYVVNERRPGLPALIEMLSPDPQVGLVAAYRWGEPHGAQVRALREHLERRTLKGLKLYPGYQPFFPTEPILRELYELAAEFKVPVMIHTGDTFSPSARVRFAHPLQIDDLAVDFPDVTFVLCHLGNPWITDAVQVAYKNDNVVADLSGLTVGEADPRLARLVMRQLNDALAYLNAPQKLMFGSDWPITHLPSHLALIRQLDATPEELEGILWRNAARVFGIDIAAGSVA